MEWNGASVECVKQMVRRDVVDLDDEQRAVFSRYAVEPYTAPITRYGRWESVVVVARRDQEVIYWEDVEEGFNVSPVDPSGAILEHGCNQDRLANALDYWIAGRRRGLKAGPASSII